MSGICAWIDCPACGARATEVVRHEGWDRILERRCSNPECKERRVDTSWTPPRTMYTPGVLDDGINYDD